jgi:transcription antitermination factor NusG
MTMPWYVVYTNANREQFALEHLIRQGYETFWLHHRKTVRHARQERLVTRSQLPRYIFAAVHPGQSIYAINTTPGVSTVLHGPAGPLELSADALADLRGRGDANGLCALPSPVERQRWKHGATVRVTAGPFAGFLALIGVDTGAAVKIWMDLFGRRVEASCLPGDLEAASPERAEHPQPLQYRAAT